MRFECFVSYLVHLNRTKKQNTYLVTVFNITTEDVKNTFSAYNFPSVKIVFRTSTVNSHFS